MVAAAAGSASSGGRALAVAVFATFLGVASSLFRYFDSGDSAGRPQGSIVTPRGSNLTVSCADLSRGRNVSGGPSGGCRVWWVC